MRRLAWLFPTGGGTVQEALAARLKDLFGEKVQLFVEHIHLVLASRLRKSLADGAVWAVLAGPPQTPRAVLELDLALAHVVVDRLLGGDGDNIGHRPLTDIEEGVVSYVMLEALKVLAPALDPGLPRLRLLGLAKNLVDAVAQLGDERQVAVCTLKVTLGTQVGYVRLLLPAAFLKLVGAPRLGSARRARRDAEVQKHLRRLSTVKALLRAEIGRAQLLGSELANLRSGDVVVIDDMWARPDQGEGGRAKLRVGAGQRAIADAELLVESGRFRAKITDFLLGEGARNFQPPPEDFPGDREDPTRVVAPPKSPEGKYVSEDADRVDLLNDIPLQLAVELGRVQVTAEEVANMATGHIIDLGRAAGDPVELSVNGKIVARGELVEIEGQLGVRVLSVLG
jgi:flagellar motor switch protein FliM